MRAKKTFGQVLRSVRKENNISQDLLAHLADLDRAYVGRLERNEAQPTLITVFALANALKVRASQLIAMMER